MTAGLADAPAPAAGAARLELPAIQEAHEPPEARSGRRDAVSLMISRRASDEISHHAFAGLPALLLPGDLVVVNTSGHAAGRRAARQRAHGRARRALLHGHARG